MFSDDIVAVIRRVVAACKNDEEFANFGYSVPGDSWGWIFRHPILCKQVDVPRPDAAPATFTPAQLVTIYQDMVAKGWTLSALMYGETCLASTIVPTPPAVQTARLRYLRDMATGLAGDVADYWKCTTHRVGDLTLVAAHEGNVTCQLFEDRATCAAWEISGEISDNWGDRATVCRNFLVELDSVPHTRPATHFATISKDKAKQLFGNIPDDSGDSCLVGMMVCDLVLSNGKRIRALSLSANIATLANGSRVGQQSSGQGESQMHMEIFHIERLEAVIAAVTMGPNETTLKSIDIAILGLKTNKTVGESVMCKACQNTMDKTIVARVAGGSVTKVSYEVYLVGP
jgi:hypothetical protein